MRYNVIHMNATRPRTLTRPVNLRVDEATRKKLDSLARAHGVKTSDIVRFAINSKIPVWEKEGVYLGKSAT